MVNGSEVLQALFGPKDWDSPQWYWLPGDGHELSWRSSYACGDWSLLHCPCISRNGRNCDEQHSQHFLHLPPHLLYIVPLTSLGHHLLLSAWFPSIETNPHHNLCFICFITMPLDPLQKLRVTWESQEPVSCFIKFVTGWSHKLIWLVANFSYIAHITVVHSLYEALHGEARKWQREEAKGPDTEDLGVMPIYSEPTKGGVLHCVHRPWEGAGAVCDPNRVRTTLSSGCSFKQRRWSLGTPNTGPIELPCGIKVFLEVLREMKQEVVELPWCHFSGGHTGYHPLGTVGRRQIPMNSQTMAPKLQIDLPVNLL